MQEETGKTPQALLDKPELDSDLVWIIQAYDVIDRSRLSGMGVNRISLGGVIDYLLVHPIPDLNERDRFIYLIFALDDEFVMWASEKQSSTDTP